jgi:hypothetical protein
MNVERKKLKTSIKVGQRTQDTQYGEYIPWDQLNDDDLSKILNEQLQPYYQQNFMRSQVINDIIKLHNVLSLEAENIILDMKKGLFNVNWIIPITDDLKIVFNKVDEPGIIVQKQTDFDQSIVDYKKSVTGQNDTENIIKAFSGYKNNLESKNGVNVTLRNTRMVYSINTSEYRIAQEEEDIKIVGIRISPDDFYNSMLLNNSYPDTSVPKIKIDYKINASDHLFDDQESFQKTIEKVANIYKDFSIKKTDVYKKFEEELSKIVLHQVDRSKAKFEPMTNYKNDIFNKKDLKDAYGQYPYSNSEDSNMQRNIWLFQKPDTGAIYYLLENPKENQKTLDELIDYTMRNNNLKMYYKSTSDSNRNTKIEVNRFHWEIINSLGENRFLKLIEESKYKNIAISNLLTKKEKEELEIFVKNYEKKISTITKVCEFDRLRFAFDESYELSRKANLLQKLIDTYGKRDKSGNVIIPDTKDKDLLIYSNLSESGCNKDIACLHEIIQFIEIPKVENEEAKEKLQTIMEQKFEILTDDEAATVCKVCGRLIRTELGVLEDIEYDSKDVGKIREGMNTKTETSIVNKINDILFAIGRQDFDARQMAEVVMPFINSNLKKEAGTKNFDLKKQIIEIAYIYVILIHSIMDSSNKFINTQIAPVVNYTLDELIKYFLALTKKLFGSLHSKIESYKLNLYGAVKTRFENLYQSANFIIEKSKRKIRLDESIDYAHLIEDYKPINKFEDILKTKENRGIKQSQAFNFLYYLSAKYLNKYQNQFYKRKMTEVDLISLGRVKIEELEVIKDKEIRNQLKDYNQILQKVYASAYPRRKLTPLGERERLDITPSKTYKSDFDERKTIIQFFIKRALDGTTQEYTLNGYSLIDGRNIETITNPDDYEFAELKKSYYKIKKEDKGAVTKIQDEFKFEKLQLPKEYNKFIEVDEKIIKNYADKVLLKTLLMNISKSSSSESTIEEVESFSKDKISTFLIELGSYINPKEEEFTRAKDDKEKIRIERKYEKLRKDNIRQYLIDLLINLEILKSKQNAINVKNLPGLRYLEKYLQFEDSFKKVKLEYNIDQIDRISRIQDLSDKKKGNVLLNIFIYSLINNSVIDANINSFFAEFVMKLYEMSRVFNMTQAEKDDKNRKDEDDIFNTIKSITFITDEERVENDISFIDLRKITDPQDFQDIIKRVEDHRTRIQNEQDYEEIDFFDEEFENVDFEI